MQCRDWMAHRIAVEWLEVEVFICYADVAGVGNQRHDHLHRTLHVRLLGNALKTLHPVHITVIKLPSQTAMTHLF